MLCCLYVTKHNQQIPTRWLGLSKNEAQNLVDEHYFSSFKIVIKLD